MTAWKASKLSRIREMTVTIRCSFLTLGVLFGGAWGQAVFADPPSQLADSSGVEHPQAGTLAPVGREHRHAKAIERVVTAGIESGEMPGAVVVMAGPNEIRFAQAYGHRRIEPEKVPMSLDTVFDMASLTKPIATASSIMKLAQQGKIDIDAKVSDYLPDFSPNGKDEITIAQLLLHVGGLIPDNALADYNDGPETAWTRICDLKLIAEPGERFAYTDVGFIVLGKIVESVSGQPLDRFAREELFEPLEMHETMFNPTEDLRQRAAPTEKRDGTWMTGEVHDPRSFRMKGVAGHAGLFSTAADLVKYGQMMLRSENGIEDQVLASATVKRMTQPRDVPRGTRTYGWDHQTGYSRNRGKSLSDAAFGHGGFTGTVMWIDPEKELIFIFLSNRLHPDGKGTVNGLAGEIATIIGAD